jgi:N-acetylmuramoyl-L-alanine amidase
MFVRYTYWLFLIISLHFSSTILAQNGKPIVLVIDAGHGGKDPGNLAKMKNGSPEKEINLKIALLLGSYLSNRLKNVKVVYTRTTDQFLSLQDRVTIANNSDANYYISIHCNFAKNSKIKGTETHIHNFDCKESFSLAEKVNQQFADRAQRYTRGTYDAADRERNLMVVKSTSMPAILIETGFMSNPQEEKYLNSEYGQTIIASAIFRGIREYLGSEYENPKLFKVLLMVSQKKINSGSTDFKKLGIKITEEVDNKAKYKYKYYADGIYNQENADNIKLKAIKCGFKEAYILPSTK